MDVFVHDRDADGNGIFDEAGKVTHRARQPRPEPRHGPGLRCRPLGGDSGDPAISGNGRYVAFHSAADQPARQRRYQRHDSTCSCSIGSGGVTRLMSTNANNVLGDGHSRNPAMSLNGRFVVFESFANNLAGGNPGTTVPDLRHLPARPRHRRGRHLRRARRPSTRCSSARNPCGRQPDQPQHRAVDHLRRPTSSCSRPSPATPRSNANCVADRHQQRPRHLHLGPPGRPAVTRRLSEASNGGQLPGRQRRAGAQRQRQPAAVPDPGRQRRRRVVARRGSIVAAVTGDGKSTTGEVPVADHRHAAAAPTCRRRRRPAARRIRRPAATATPPATRPSPIPGTGEGEPVVEARRDAARRRRHAVHRRPVARRPARPPAARSSRSRAPTSSAGQTACCGTAASSRFTFVNSSLAARRRSAARPRLSP